MSKNDHRRRRVIGLINNKEIQFRYGFLMIIAALLTAVGTNSVVIYKISEISNYCLTSGGELNSSPLMDFMNYLIAASIVMILVIGVVFFYFVLKMTHRFFGPLVPINRHLDQMLEGKYDSRVVLRKGDELKDLAEKLNRLAENLQNKKTGS